MQSLTSPQTLLVNKEIGTITLKNNVVLPLFFFFIFKLYITVLVLPNIKMNPPQVYMCSLSIKERYKQVKYKGRRNSMGVTDRVS